MKILFRDVARRLGVYLIAVAVCMGMAPQTCLSASAFSQVRLRGHVPEKAVAYARWIERLPAKTEIPMALSLPLRNQQDLEQLLNRMYDPNDSLYGRYLTTEEFIDRFCPTQADYDAVKNYATGLGFQITGTWANRTLLNVTGAAGAVESAFKFHMQRYQASSGRYFHAPDDDPEVPDFIASRISGVVGLDDAAVWHTNSHLIPSDRLFADRPVPDRHRPRWRPDAGGHYQGV